MSDNDREGYIAGLRALADALEQHPEVPLPYQGHVAAMTMHFLHDDNARQSLAAVARALPCDWRKEVRSDDSAPGGGYFDLEGSLHGLLLRLTAFRDDVCTRVVTGTREVTEKVKDPDALAAVPEVEVTRTVEDVTWECGPLLRDGQS